MARKQKGAAQAAAPATASQKESSRLDLIDEAMGEIEALTKRCFELEKIAGQLGDLGDLSLLLWEARTLRLLADPDDGQSVHAAITSRQGAPEASVRVIEAAARRLGGEAPPPVVATVSVDSAEVRSLLEEATAEIERLSKELDLARASGEDKSVTPEEWKQILDHCGVEDSATVVDVLRHTRVKIGDDYNGEALDDAVDKVLSGAEENKAKAEIFDDLLENKLDGIVADAMEEAIESHESPLKEVWTRLTPFDRRRIMHVAKEHATEAVASLGEEEGVS